MRKRAAAGEPCPVRTGRWLATGVLGVPEEGADHLGGIHERGRSADGHRPGRGRGGLALEPVAVDGVLGAVRRAGMQDLQFLPAVVVGDYRDGQVRVGGELDGQLAELGGD
jgi:hypothetical protein